MALGNDLLCDDGVGIAVAREVGRFANVQDVEVVESGESGLALLELLVGYDNVVIVDAMHSGAVAPGTISILGPDSFQRVVAPSAHFCGLPEILDLGRRLQLPMPSKLNVVAIEVSDMHSFSTVLTREVVASIPRAVEIVAAMLRAANVRL